MSTIDAVPNRDAWFVEVHGFPRPRWHSIYGWMRAFRQGGSHDDWVQMSRHWLARLRDSLGGGYAVAESTNFLVVSDLPGPARDAEMRFLEKGRAQILSILGEIADPNARGKHVVLRFSETDDYYAYLAPHYGEGTFAMSGGVLLTDGYAHIAYPVTVSGEDRRALAHELTHDLLVHLPLPPWLNEALAMVFELRLGGGEYPLLDAELVARHREYWTPETIQGFWRGDSFHDVDAQELSYSLARILLSTIQTSVRPAPEHFRRFVLSADASDAGAEALREHLDCELGDLVGAFLGPGDWAPKLTPPHGHGTQET